MALCTRCARNALAGEACPADEHGWHRLPGLRLDGGEVAGLRLDRVMIDGDLSCAGTTFTDALHLSEVEVTGGIDLTSARFDRYVAMTGVQVGTWIRCNNAVFAHDVSLAQVRCDDLSLAQATFDGPADVRDVRVKRLDLRRATFHHRSSFHLTEAERVSVVRTTFDRGMHLALGMGTEVELEDVDLAAPSTIAAGTDTVRQWRLENRPVLIRADGTDLSLLRLSYVDLSVCSFAGAHNLDRLTVEDGHAWRTSPGGWVTYRHTLADEHRVRDGARWRIADDPLRAPSLDSVVGDYHALRRLAQARQDQRAASHFYYGEMEMRRIGLRRMVRATMKRRQWRAAASTTGEWLLVTLYWFVSGYGQRAWRAFATLALVVAFASMALARWGFAAPTGYPEALRFSVRAATTLFRGQDTALTPAGDWIELVLRLVAPLLLALGLLAIRERVRR